MEDRIAQNARGCTEPVKGKPGTYRLYFSLGKNSETGKYERTRRRTYHCRSKNPKNWPKELENALAEYRRELEGSTEPRTHKRTQTVAAYAEDFHAMREGTMGSPLSYKREGYDVRHIGELFGDFALKDLTSDDVRRAYADARKSGRFKESELKRIHAKLKQIMQNAVDNDIIVRNPCSGITIQYTGQGAREAIDAEKTDRLEQCLLGEEPCASVAGAMILLHTGMRKGEMLGLTWDDYSSDNRTIRINKQYTNDRTLRPPKSKMSNRTIAIDGTLIDFLNKWKEIQAEKLRSLSVEQSGATPIVNAIRTIRDEDGSKRAMAANVDGSNYSRWFRNYCADHDFGELSTVTNTFTKDNQKHIRGTGYSGLVPHALRHTQATILLESGTDYKTVQARLGHASPSTTLSIYAHTSEANDARAANAFDSAIHSAKQS